MADNALNSKIELIVRDYECDVQGIVNNAVYLNYLEHARHQHLLQLDIDFVKMAAQGSNMVVTDESTPPESPQTARPAPTC